MSQIATTPFHLAAAVNHELQPSPTLHINERVGQMWAAGQTVQRRQESLNLILLVLPSSLPRQLCKEDANAVGDRLVSRVCDASEQVSGSS